MSRRPRPLLVTLVAAAVLGAACGDDGDSGTAETTTTEVPAEEVEPEPVDAYPDHQPDQYAGTSSWICHPDLADDPCRDLATTVIEPDGSRRVDALEPAEDPAFDCFYAYPTTSGDPGPLSDLDVDETEIDTVRAQVARFSTVCRVFAPAYRQVTLTGLGGGATAEDREVAYGDVLDAWKTYVVEANEGLGVVLLGHSQGAGYLRRVLAEEVEGHDGLRSLLVSAALLGSAVTVPEGELVGGDLEQIPACEHGDQVGCVMSWASFPAEEPPTEATRFGRTSQEGREALCTDPAALVGEGVVVGAVLPTKVTLVGGIEGFEDLGTPFVSLPRSLRTSCERAGGATYLAVALADPDDARPVAGLMEQRLGPAWGLHLLDASIAQDELISILARQAEAHASSR
jgi:hypothetical protein